MNIPVMQNVAKPFGTSHLQHFGMQNVANSSGLFAIFTYAKPMQTNAKLSTASRLQTRGSAHYI
jgi:hypothetical protein